MKRNAHDREKLKQHCWTGKVRYRRERAALQMLEKQQELAERGQTSYRQTRVYYCDSCHGWHLTSKEDRWALPSGQNPQSDV